MENSDYFKFVKYANELKRNKESLFKKNKEVFNLLLNFRVIIEENLHQKNKNDYIELIIDFLENNITATDFSGFFINIYESVNQNLCQMEKDENFSELSNYLIKNNNFKVGESLSYMYGECDYFNSNIDLDLNMSNDILTENLKNQAKILLQKLQQI